MKKLLQTDFEGSCNTVFIGSHMFIVAVVQQKQVRKEQVVKDDG
jgi:DNA-directed RNA polymerase subunit E'/Rpb7